MGAIQRRIQHCVNPVIVDLPYLKAKDTNRFVSYTFLAPNVLK